MDQRQSYPFSPVRRLSGGKEPVFAEVCMMQRRSNDVKPNWRFVSAIYNTESLQCLNEYFWKISFFAFLLTVRLEIPLPCLYCKLCLLRTVTPYF